MAGMRDDSAGPYGQWTNDSNQSWLDYLGMKAADVGGGAYNALANITGSLSPIGTSEQGNMALQVPPMVSGLYDSAKRIGERGGFTRVEEFDAPLKQDLANALLTFYGGNALSGITKPKGALGAGAMREADQLGFDFPESKPAPMRAYRGSPSPNDLEYAKQAGKFWASSDPDVASIYTQITPYNEHHFMKPGVPFQPTLRTVDMEFANPMTIDAGGASFDRVPFGGSKSTADALAEIAQQRGHDGLVLNNVHDGVKVANTYAAVKPGTVRSAKTGQIVFSDNKPSILGAALATAGEQPIRAYRGATNAGNIARDDASILWGSSSPEVASTYARPHFTNYDIEGAVAPLDMDFRNPLTVDANGKHWAELEHGGQRYTADDLANLAKSQGHDGLIVKNVMDTKSWYPGEPRTMPADTYVALQRGTVKSPLTGETLFSDNKPSLLGAALATAGEQPSILGKIPSAFDQDIQSAGSFQPPGVYKMNALEALLHSKVMNAPGVQRMRNGEMVEVPPLNDLANASEALSPYDISALDKAWRNKTRQTGELFSRPVPLPPQQEDNLPPWLKF